MKSLVTKVSLNEPIQEDKSTTAWLKDLNTEAKYSQNCN